MNPPTLRTFNYDRDTLGRLSELNVKLERFATRAPGLPTKSEADREPLTLTDLVRTHRCIVVLGDPGSGKTTLAKYLVVALVDGLPDLAPLSKEVIPIRIPLRTYAEYRHRS